MRIKQPLYFVLGFFVLSAIFTMVFFDGTGDAGDSILHYLYAKSVPKHPENLLNHWAKPLFTLLAFPFAQLGFIGMKVFNVVIVFFTLILTYRVSELLNLKYAWLAPLLLICSPLYYALCFSGLTEPLFALIGILSTYGVLKKQYNWSAVCLSFLPFVRSEGLIILLVFATYFLVKKNWKAILLLLTGHLVYSVAGYFYYEDLLWVFTKIPYAALESVYGKGRLLHFVDQLIYVVGIPIYLLFWLGLIAGVLKLIRKNMQLELWLLVYGSFIAFFAAHSLFWYLGIFNSLGLKRVLIGVLPFLAIMVVSGFNYYMIELGKNRTFTKVLSGIIVALVLVFPFTKNHAALQWKRDLMLKPEQKIMLNIAKDLTHKGKSTRTMIYASVYLSEALKVDHFNPQQHLDLNKIALTELKTGDIVIWDDWFAGFEKGISLLSLEQRADLQVIYREEIGRAHV